MLIKQAPQNSNNSKQQDLVNEEKKSNEGNDKGKKILETLYFPEKKT